MTSRYSVQALALALSELAPGEGRDLAELILAVGGIDAVRHCNAGQLERRQLALLTWLRESLQDDRIEFWKTRLETVGRRADWSFLSVTDSAYPPLLRQAWHRPPYLFSSREDLQPWPRLAAIVGSRRASDEALRFTEQAASSLARRGFGIVSGAARGVDAYAHRSAMDASGYTVAVLPHGLGALPETGASLLEQIRKSGTLVSEFHPGAPATKSTYLQRNRTITGMSAFTLVVEPRTLSGSSSAAEDAATLQRPLMLWGPDLHDQPWSQAMIEQGLAMVVRDVDDVLRHAEPASRG